MKDVATPVPQNEVRAVIKKSLENAALVNYERLSEEARIEGNKISKKFKIQSIFRTFVHKLFISIHLLYLIFVSLEIQ